MSYAPPIQDAAKVRLTAEQLRLCITSPVIDMDKQTVAGDGIGCHNGQLCPIPEVTESLFQVQGLGRHRREPDPSLRYCCER